MQRLYSSVLNRAPSEIYPLSLHDALPISGAETRLETVASRRARREGSGKRIRPFQTSSNEPSHSTREQERRTMKYILLGSMLAAILLPYGAVMYGQEPDFYGNRRTNPTGSPDIRGIPNAHGESRTSRVPSALPDSHIPPRSPDLGLPTFPLSPSIGPGSGLL